MWSSKLRRLRIVILGLGAIFIGRTSFRLGGFSGKPSLPCVPYVELVYGLGFRDPLNMCRQGTDRLSVLFDSSASGLGILARPPTNRKPHPPKNSCCKLIRTRCSTTGAYPVAWARRSAPEPKVELQVSDFDCRSSSRREIVQCSSKT